MSSEHCSLQHDIELQLPEQEPLPALAAIPLGHVGLLRFMPRRDLLGVGDSIGATPGEWQPPVPLSNRLEFHFPQAKSTSSPEASGDGKEEKKFTPKEITPERLAEVSKDMKSDLIADLERRQGQ